MKTAPVLHDPPVAVPLSGPPAGPASSRATVQALLAAAVARHRRGELEAAEALYRRVVARVPDQCDALHLLAVLLGKKGRTTEAERLFRKALPLAPQSAALRSNFGNLLSRLGRFEESAAAYEAALALDPDFPDALANYAGLLVRTGRYAEAEEMARRALALDPEHPIAKANLAGSLAQRGRVTEAAAVLDGLGTVPAEAAADVALTRGHVALAEGRLTEAAAAYREVLRERPAELEARQGLGVALTLGRDLEEAELHLLEFVGKRPGPSLALGMLGHLRVVSCRLEGLRDLRRAVGRADAGPAEYSTYLFDLNYDPDLDGETLCHAHREWDLRFGGRTRNAAVVRRRPGPRLRLGLVSPDFRAHSVSFFLLPLLRALDRSRFEVTCYSNVRNPDRVTEQFREVAERWRDIARARDSEVAAWVAEDGIDVLVDLAGHTSDNRLPLFTSRVAPVQVTYLGYPNTTGLTSMDARIVDRITDPEGAESHAVERLVRLDRCFLTYEPDAWPPVAPPPCLARGGISFGSFNNVAKLNPRVADLWARILRAVPGSRLVLKHDVTGLVSVQERIRGWFKERGVDPGRIVFLDRAPGLVPHLETYREVDIALDTFPYNGTTTTCEALWMGVPVVTLTGERHAARVGTSLLHAAGFVAGIARDPDDYVATAVQLAGLPQLLEHLRWRLRHELVASPLMDAAGLARAFEDALSDLARRCAAGPDPAAAHAERTWT